MAEWRVGRSWSSPEIQEKLGLLASLNTCIGGGPWRHYYTEAVISFESPGPPVDQGAFDRAWMIIQDYQFSDPRIVAAYFDSTQPLLGRNILLELKAFGLHYLCGTRITAVRNRTIGSKTQRGFRYATLQGHLEEGQEWFLLTKDHESGEVCFRIEASWKPGTAPGGFPNWWSALGFRIVGERYQLIWHRRAYLRLRLLLAAEGRQLTPLPRGRSLIGATQDADDPELWV